MQTTLTLDDDVAAKIEEELHRQGRTFKEAVNELLREGLEARRERPQDVDETSPNLAAQIREGYQEYLRGELRPIEEFMTELEAELASEQVLAKIGSIARDQFESESQTDPQELPTKTKLMLGTVDSRFTRPSQQGDSATTML